MIDWSELGGAPPPLVFRRRPLADAEEVLVLSYTCDLGFFEDVCLPQIRPTRARTTVLYDAARLTGRSQRDQPADYLALPVACRNGAAFHPKLVVIASATEAVISIGSGNATASGWHHNAEVWTHLHLTEPTVPQLCHDLADWLRRLGDILWMEDIGRERLERTAQLLRHRPVAGTSSDLVLLTSDHTPIMDQLRPLLSRATSARLAVASPFFDTQAEALRTLVELVRPESTQLLLTRHVQGDPVALKSALARAGTWQARPPLHYARYHHGKIIEWITPGAAWAVTGSANCTRAALMRAADSGGNCELALLAPIGASLVEAIADDPIDLDYVEYVSPAPESEQTPPLLVLGIRAHGSWVEVNVLVHRGATPQLVEVGGRSLAHARSSGRVHTYVTEFDAEWFAALSGTARVSWSSGDESGDAEAVVTDVGRAIARVEQPSPLENNAWDRVIGDEALRAALLYALAHLRTVRPEELTSPHASMSRRRLVTDAITMATGPALLRFTLGGAVARPDDRGGEEPGDQADRSLPPPTSRDVDQRQRARLRQFAHRVLDAMDGAAMPAALASARTVLLIIAADVFDEPAEWLALLERSVLLVWTTPTEQALEAEQAALTTIGLVALARGLSAYPEAHPDLRRSFEALRDAGRQQVDHLRGAPDESLRGYAADLTGSAFGYGFPWLDFRDELSWILARSALADAVDRLPAATLRDGVVNVATTTVLARRVLLHALDELRQFPDTRVVVEGVTAMCGWWNGRRLLQVIYKGGRWQAEVWHNLPTGIAAYARGVAQLRRPDRQWTVDDPVLALEQADRRP
ncbi:hypothetical protein [Catellatospora bangladeshensis]|uniref:Phospholipase D-like domain-containing protein n=1 Tax=Catellatospora bangladeshensis TaxID=310355 RepID=A0A8J3JYK3_9ACTN|nr:hypothetical protein [Catellatospora bangladeshensis]GIF86059.1 hypothetical protein Cba03nite_74080 [Catellatospora bangladeshensis]